MAISKRTPRTILLAPSKDKVVLVDEEDFLASAAITPGMLVEMHDNSGATAWRPHDTDSEMVSVAVALDRPENNYTIDTDYAVGDMVPVAFLPPGAMFYGIIPSGQDISNAELLQSNGDGKLKAATATTATANTAKFQSLDNPGSVTVDTRIRVQVIQ